MRQAFIRWAVCLVLFVKPQEALLSQVHFERASFERILQAPVILVVEPAQPATEEVSLPVEGAPDFVKRLSIFRVIEVLRDGGNFEKSAVLLIDAKPVLHMPSVKAGAMVRVHAADLRSKIDLHQRYYRDEVRKSPLYERYEPRFAPTQKRQIVFLRHEPWNELPEYAWFLEGAHEGIEALPQLRKALQENRPRGR